MKLSSKSKPRLTIYLSPLEMRTVKKQAAEAGLRTPHQWAAQLIRKQLPVAVPQI